MKKRISLPRGTSDILPQEASLLREVESNARKLLNLYGYKEIRTPLFEETELFARSVGQTSDIVQKQMLNLASQLKPGERTIKLSGLSLRPEGTASVVRSYIQNSLDRKEKLSKLFYIGPMFRGERPQKGRLRQFSQIGVEAIGPGSSSPYLDAEIISLSVNILKSLGLKNFELRINTLGTLDSKKQIQVKLEKKLLKERSKLCDDCKDRVKRNAFRVLDCKNKACKEVVKTIGFGPDWLDDESRNYYNEVKGALDDLGIKYKEDGSLVRGLDYYTNTVFEIYDSSSDASQNALGAGGRYDCLVAQLGGPQVDAIGFALGIERILLALPKGKTPKEEGLDVYVISLSDKTLKKSIRILNNLRKQGISADMNYSVSSLKSQMRSADKSNARYAVILGEDEDKRGIVALKDMESGNQKEVKVSKDNINNLVNELKKKGSK